MILVVADTSPVRYLILVGAIEVLPKLYDAVVIPEAVLSELQHPSAPAEVRGWTAKLPGWITVRSPARVETELHLGLGELEAIALTGELGAAAAILILAQSGTPGEGTRPTKGRFSGDVGRVPSPGGI